MVVPLLAWTACAPASPPEPKSTVAETPRPEPPRPAPPVARPPDPADAPLPEKLETPAFILVKAGPDDTPASLAARHLNDADKAWMIADYASGRRPDDVEYRIVPKAPWNRVGVFPSGYQMVPVLAYEGIARERSGRLVVAQRTFEQQMQHLQTEGFRPVSLREFLEFVDGRRQLPMKSVLLTFDGGQKAFLRHARPMLKELKFPATLFVPLDAVDRGDGMTWPELTGLLNEGFDVQTYGKTRTDLKRQPGESTAQYDARMEAELSVPIIRFRQYFARTSETLAYPLGAPPDDELMKHVRRNGFVAGFTTQRERNAAFVPPLLVGRTQVRADMTMAEFGQSLAVFHKEPVAAVVGTASADPGAAPAPPSGPLSERRRLVLHHSARAEELEREGHLRQALDERTIAAALAPGDERTRAAVSRLEAKISETSARLLSEARRLQAQGSAAPARQHLLALLSIDPANRAAFESLRERTRETPFLVHTVKAGDTLADLAHLYYGDSRRADAIAGANALAAGAQLVPGRTLRIPELPGIPLLPR